MLWLKLSKTLGQELLITRISLYYALIVWDPVLWSLALGLPRFFTPSLQIRMLVSSPSSAVVWKYMAVSQIAGLLTLSFSDHWLIFNAIKLTFFKYFSFFLCFFGGGEVVALVFLFFWGSFFETGSQYVIQSGLELSMLAQTDLKSPDIHLPPPPGSWDNEYVLPCQGLWLTFLEGVLFKAGTQNDPYCYILVENRSTKQLIFLKESISHFMHTSTYIYTNIQIFLKWCNEEQLYFAFKNQLSVAWNIYTGNQDCFKILKLLLNAPILYRNNHHHHHPTFLPFTSNDFPISDAFTKVHSGQESCLTIFE